VAALLGGDVWTIMSMFTPAVRKRAGKTRCATPGRSGTPISVSFDSDVSSGDSPENDRLLEQLLVLLCVSRCPLSG
jgi:hypothetical protein